MSWPRKIFKLQDGFIRQDPEQLVGKKVLLLRKKIGVIRGYKPPTTWRKETYCIEIENQRLEIHSRKCAKLGIIRNEKAKIFFFLFIINENIDNNNNKKKKKLSK